MCAFDERNHFRLIIMLLKQKLIENRFKKITFPSDFRVASIIRQASSGPFGREKHK